MKSTIKTWDTSQPNHCIQTPYTSGIADETFFYTVTEKKFSTRQLIRSITDIKVRNISRKSQLFHKKKEEDDPMDGVETNQQFLQMLTRGEAEHLLPLRGVEE